jgi:hypothetical protein
MLPKFPLQLACAYPCVSGQQIASREKNSLIFDDFGSSVCGVLFRRQSLWDYPGSQGYSMHVIGLLGNAVDIPLLVLSKYYADCDKQKRDRPHSPYVNGELMTPGEQ